MKMIKPAFNLILICTLLAFTSESCIKGDDGVDGTPGKNGTANISSRTYKVSNWLYASPNHYANLHVPELTSTNINSTGVLVYFTYTGNDWVAVPFTQYTSASNYVMGFITSSGNVRITWFYDASTSSGEDPNTYYKTELQFKVVIIPPADKVKKSGVDYTNYDDVKENFNLKD